MTTSIRFDPAEEVKKFRAAATALRRLERDGSTATVNAINRQRQNQRVAHVALMMEGRWSLIGLVTEEAKLVFNIADSKETGVDRSDLFKRLREIRAEIKVELDPNVIAPGQAQDTLNAIKAQFGVHIDAEYGDGPNLRENDHEALPIGYWSIDWDGGPEMWTLNVGRVDEGSDIYLLALRNGMNHRQATRTAQDPALRIPHGVGLEAANGVILHLYPEV